MQCRKYTLTLCPNINNHHFKFKEKMKKILLTLFTFVLALNVAAQEYKTSGVCHDMSWAVNDGVLTISGTGKMADHQNTSSVEWLNQIKRVVVDGETYEKALHNTITKVIISNDITHIGAYSFSNMSKLTEVVLPKTLESIGSNAFNNCTSLSTLSGDCDFAKLNITSSTFSGAKVINTDGSLYIAHKLVCVYTEGYNNANFSVEEKTTEICANAFNGNTNLKSITIPVSVTKIGNNAFYGCTNLSTFNLSGNDVTFGSNVFTGCTSLPSDGTYRKAGDNIIVEVYDTDEEIYQIPSKIIYIADNAFAKCTNVKTIKCASTPAMATNALFNDNGPHLYVEDGNENKFQGKGITSDKINHTDINLHSSGYSTIALDHSAIIPTGVEAYTVTSDGTTIHYKRVIGNKLAKGTGYFIVGTGKATFTPAKESIAEGNDNNLVGVTEKTEVSGSGIYFLSTTQKGVTGFFCLGDDNSYEFPANKAYLQVSGTIGNAQYFLVNLDETETRIDNTESEEKTSHSRNNVYNLAGQKMSHPQKGINIVNGKLTIM